jgi:hypothetical protein
MILITNRFQSMLRRQMIPDRQPLGGSHGSSHATFLRNRGLALVFSRLKRLSRLGESANSSVSHSKVSIEELSWYESARTRLRANKLIKLMMMMMFWEKKPSVSSIWMMSIRIGQGTQTSPVHLWCSIYLTQRKIG